MIFKKNYKGLISNLFLVFLALGLGKVLAESNAEKNDAHLPIYLMFLFAFLLLFEKKANQNILSIEFSAMDESQSATWQWFSSKGFFGLIIILSLIWRSYGKLVFLLFPLIDAILYSCRDYDFLPTWFNKLLYALVFIWAVYQELVLVAQTLEPPTHFVSERSELWSRIIVVAIMVYFTHFMQIMFGEYVDFTWNDMSKGRAILPFMFIIFLFFYVPLRWVELVANAIDSRSRLDLFLFGLTTFITMLITLN